MFLKPQTIENLESKLQEISERYPAGARNLIELAQEIGASKSNEEENKCFKGHFNYLTQQEIQEHISTLRTLKDKSKRIPLTKLRYSPMKRGTLMRIEGFVRRVEEIESISGKGAYSISAMTPEEKREETEAFHKKYGH